MLSPYRVLDLTSEYGLLCGQILADLGADVIQVEPPGASSARRVGPWVGGEPGPERSLFWAAYARNKRSIVLDLEDPDDRAVLLRLVSGADFLIESERPGRMAELGLSYDELSRIQPGLVYVSITPFGQTGPKAQWAATDLTLMAAGGFAYLSGEAERPPTRVRVPQAHAQAGADAAVGALIAHAERSRTGLGQHVDVSLQESVTLATMFRILDEPIGQVPAQRIAGGYQSRGVFLQIRHRTRDGWVTLGPSMLPSTGHFMKRLLTWAAEEGFCEQSLVEEDWSSFWLRVGSGRIPKDAYKPVAETLEKFFATKTNAELMHAAVSRKLLIAPVLGVDEFIESKQLAARGFPVSLRRSDGGTARYPGPFARFSTTPIRYRYPPPRLDEHGAELRAESARIPAPAGSAEAGELPLSGVKILDLFWVIAGPTATRTLADYGATVVRVESMRHIDTLRTTPPHQFSEPHPEGAIGFQSANANKLGITVDLASDEGRQIIFDLLSWADVVTESFAPGVMESLGLGWEELRKRKPDLIMISSCVMGQTGPWRDYAGFGRLAVSVIGFQLQASWPDRPPSGPFGAYTDAIASRYNAAAILAALEHRRRTSEGQHIDLSQAEASLHFLAPAFLDWTVNAHVQEPCGNTDGELFPHGMFPATGEDRWVAIAVRDDADWRALCDVIGRPDLLERRHARGDIEAEIAKWTSEREASAIEAALQARGVPAHVALDTPGLFTDPQIQHREHFIEIEHDIYPTTTVENSRLCLSRTPARRPERALSFGRDNRYVLETMLGYSPERIAELAANGVLS